MTELAFGLNFRLSYPCFSNSNAKRMIYRSGCCDIFSPKDLTSLSTQLGIKTWLDLRENKEKKINLFNCFDTYKIKYLACPLSIKEDKILPDIPTVMDYLKYYELLCTNTTQQLANFFSRLNQSLFIGNVAISCYAGKDRTGVICYLIHQILRSSPKAIQQDFVSSKDYLIHRQDIFLKNSIKKHISYEQYAQRFLLCDEIYIAFNNWFKKTYQDISYFFVKIGLTDRFVDEFRQHF